jgi:TonB family protein
VIGIGLWLYFRPRGSKAPEVTAGGPEAGSLLLRAERNAGQLLLSWNREAALVKTASKAVLLISDGDHKEEVELDLGQLRNGSIVYSPVTNDVSFRLEVTDAKQGKSLNESVRVLAGRPSPTPTPPTGQTAIPRATAPAGEAKPRQEPAQPAPAPAKPEDAVGGNSAGAGETASATPAQPPRTMAPIPVAARGAESLTARISQTANLPLPPLVESQATPPPVRAAETSAAPAVAPPPAAVKETPKPAPQPPAPGPPVVDTPPLSATQAPAPPEPLKVGGNVQEAKLIRRTTPVYPPLARQARVTGVVRVEATIGKDGKITRVAAVSGPPLLRQAATDSVRQWIYQPSLLNGQPVEVVTQVDVSFNLGR